MSSKHFINNGDDIVLDALEGLCFSQPELVFDKRNKGEWLYRPINIKMQRQ